MNQNLKQLGKQLIEIWKQLGLNQRISVVLAGAAVMVGLGALTFFSTRVSYAPLFNSLDPGDSAKVVQELDKQKVPYQLAAGGATVLVPEDKVDRLRLSLATSIGTGDIPGWESVVGQTSTMQSDLIQRANLRHVKDGLLARTIMKIDEVESAQVHVVESSGKLIVGPDEHASASVVVKARGGQSISQETVRSIQALVANSVAGLRRSNVSVSDNHGRLLTEDYDENSPIGRAGNRFAVQQQVEAYYAKQVRSLLDPVLGPGASRVAISVDLDMNSINSTERKVDPATKTPKTITEKNETTSSTSGGAGAAPGIASNSASTNNTGAAASPNLSNTTSKTTETQNDFDVTVKEIVQQAGSIRRISASVVVDTRYQGTGTNRVAVPRTPQELDKLKEVVRTALGIQNNAQGGTSADEITLEEIPFNEEPMIEVNQQLEKQQKLNFWLSLAQKFAYPALAVFILFVFLRAFRNTTVEQIPIGVPVGELEADGSLGASDWNGNGKPRVVTVDVLNQLVKENPRNVTQAIRSWLGGGANKN